ncbi:MAG: 8-amino-7-oxononanoate synthase [Candidatus Omnitrophica bacterium]|nr:8-amino-7-oxononanoate synthase [Candidatus Omnitrophota bacterium]
MLEEELEEELNLLKRDNLYRKLSILESPPGPDAIIDGKEVILFSSNNYLGIATHPEVLKSSGKALKKFGASAGASRLMAGNLESHEELEDEIASFKGTPDALVFSSGYLANIGAISSILKPGDIAIIDRLNHASIIDGCRLSGARILVYPHRNTARLKEILRRYFRRKSGNRRCMIITESVFSMDGDIAPIPEILKLAAMYNSSVLIDDAHATGVLGKTGRGSLEHFGINLKDGSYDNKITVIQMGTLSKALGALGGYIAGSKPLTDYLRNKARSFIYTTALPPSVAASALTALKIIQSEPAIINKLRKNIAYLRKGLRSAGYNISEDETPIIPVILGESGAALRLSKALFENGIFAPAIRPPTVPKGESRIRLSVTAAHKREHLDFVIESMRTSLALEGRGDG